METKTRKVSKKLQIVYPEGKEEPTFTSVSKLVDSLEIGETVTVKFIEVDKSLPEGDYFREWSLGYKQITKEKDGYSIQRNYAYEY